MVLIDAILTVNCQIYTVRFSTQGGRADENFRNCNAAHVQHLRWRDDVVDGSNGTLRVVLRVV